MSSYLHSDPNINPAPSSIIRGRCVALNGREAVVYRFLPGALVAQNHAIAIDNPQDIRIGDVIEVQNNRAKTLTPNRMPKTDGQAPVRWSKRILDRRRLKAIRIRNQVEATIREFFLSRDFLETRTPLLVPSPGMETHIRPFPVERPQHFGSGNLIFPLPLNSR